MIPEGDSGCKWAMMRQGRRKKWKNESSGFFMYFFVGRSSNHRLSFTSHFMSLFLRSLSSHLRWSWTNRRFSFLNHSKNHREEGINEDVSWCRKWWFGKEGQGKWEKRWKFSLKPTKRWLTRGRETESRRWSSELQSRAIFHLFSSCCLVEYLKQLFSPSLSLSLSLSCL